MHSLTKFLLALSFSFMTATPQSAVARRLRSIIRGDVEFDTVSRRLYSTDAGLTQIEPLGVVCPLDTDDVVRLVQYAAETGLSLVPRGMGSGLNGGAVGPGIQVDFSRHMNSIVEVAADSSWVRVQPGVVLATLNHSLRPRGVFFPPDPSSENHCSLGGMIGTNASGARSVAYGATKDHVLRLETVMADGSVFRAHAVPADALVSGSGLDNTTLAGGAFSTVLAELSDKRELITSRLPKVVKNACGYRVETLLDHLPSATPCTGEDNPAAGRGSTNEGAFTDGMMPLQKLFVGAEGTLGLVTEATLHLAPLAAQRGIAMVYFGSVFAAGEAVPGILALGPTALEIMDSKFLDLVRKNDSKIDAMLPTGADTALLVEFEANDQQGLDESFAALAEHLRSTSMLQLVRAVDEADTALLWRVRKSAVPLMQRSRGRRQPLPFIEDITVEPSQIPGCISFLQKLLDREGIEAVMVGHVGDGNLHTRPMLDPRDPADRLVMQRIYDEVSSYVLQCGGTLSGEHGDGLVHTPRLQAMYGPEVYRVFRNIKQAFDPGGVLNPGKKVAPQELTDSLLLEARYGPGYETLPQRPLLSFVERGFESEIERCHGCAACKSALSTTMCPTYKATHREHASPRAKANLLRAVVSGTIDPKDAVADRMIKQVIDYCIGCGMCAVECPSAVNIPKLALEAKSRYRQRHRASVAEFVLSRAESVASLGMALSPLANRLLTLAPARLAAQFLLGIDRRRPMAPFARHSLRRRWTDSRSVTNLDRARDLQSSASSSVSHPSGDSNQTVAYFHDLYADCYDPELGLTVLRVLAAHGLQTALPRQKASGIPEMQYGYARQAKNIAARNVSGALPHVQAGALLVSSEPTASFAFKVHYPDYLGTPECSEVADATRDLGEFLVARRRERPELAPEARAIQRPDKAEGTPAARLDDRIRVAYHQPCHLKAQSVGNPSVELLSQIPGVEVIDLAAGCCGMAGTFGMKTGTYDFSMAVGQPLFQRISEVKPDILVSECSTCRMQLAHATGLPTVHPITLLAESYRS